jgi:DNA-binding response OmpR family regulator
MPASVSSEQPRSVSAAAGKLPHILLVDDEQGILRLLHRALAEEGYDVLSAADAPSAIELVTASARPLDLAVVDIRLPGMDGMDLVATLRQSQPALPVLFISGIGDASERHRVSDPLLAKPFEVDEFRQRVRDAIGG